MPKLHISLLVLVYALGFISSSKFGCGSLDGGYWNRSFIESEKQALLLLKKNLVDELIQVNQNRKYRGCKC